MKSLLRLFLAAFCALTAPTLRADLINLTSSFPDIFASPLNTSYNAGTGALSVSGAAQVLSYDLANFEDITGGVFSLNAFLDSSGQLMGGGTFSVTGTTPSFAGSPLLAGTLTSFGFSEAPGGSVLEFLFSVNGGSALSLFGNNGGIILSSSGYMGIVGGFNNAGFTSDSASADIFAQPSSVPENTSTGLLLAIGCVLFGLFRFSVRRWSSLQVTLLR